MQERLLSNLELCYQIIVLSIKNRKGFVKLMILIALFKKFLGYQSIVIVEVSNVAKFSSNKNLNITNVYSINKFFSYTA